LEITPSKAFGPQFRACFDADILDRLTGKVKYIKEEIEFRHASEAEINLLIAQSKGSPQHRALLPAGQSYSQPVPRRIERFPETCVYFIFCIYTMFDFVGILRLALNDSTEL